MYFGDIVLGREETSRRNSEECVLLVATSRFDCYQKHRIYTKTHPFSCDCRKI